VQEAYRLQNASRCSTINSIVAERHVVIKRARNAMLTLIDIANMRANIFYLIVAVGVAKEVYLAMLWEPKPRYEMKHGRFARTGTPD
jgi:hypothetical protein